MSHHPDRCGQPGTTIRGRLPKGYVRIQITGTGDGPGRWYCSTTCATRALTSATTRTDVGDCPTCTNRHNRGHRCPVCGSTPQVIPTRPTPTRGRLYDFPIPDADQPDQPREDHPA